jgi:hypothetical protein
VRDCVSEFIIERLVEKLNSTERINDRVNDWQNRCLTERRIKNSEGEGQRGRENGIQEINSGVGVSLTI